MMMACFTWEGFIVAYMQFTVAEGSWSERGHARHTKLEQSLPDRDTQLCQRRKRVPIQNAEAHKLIQWPGISRTRVNRGHPPQLPGTPRQPIKNKKPEHGGVMCHYPSGYIYIIVSCNTLY